MLADFGDNKSGKKLTLYLPTDGIVHGSTKLTLVKTTPTLQQERTPVVTLAYWNLSRLWTLGGAVAATALLFLLVTQLLKLQPKGNPALAGTHLNWFQRFLLDPETNTYSLSYLQLFLWSATSIVAYLTLVIARALVQGAVEWPDIPGNLPGLIFISAGTTALAEGITAIKGPKGGGPSEPNWTDLNLQWRGRGGGPCTVLRLDGAWRGSVPVLSVAQRPDHYDNRADRTAGFSPNHGDQLGRLSGHKARPETRTSLGNRDDYFGSGGITGGADGERHRAIAASPVERAEERDPANPPSGTDAGGYDQWEADHCATAALRRT